MDPGFKAQCGLIGEASKSAFDGKPFGRDDGEEDLEHGYGTLSMAADKNGNQGSEFYFFLEQADTVCAAQMDQKHQVIGETARCLFPAHSGGGGNSPPPSHHRSRALTPTSFPSLCLF